MILDAWETEQFLCDENSLDPAMTSFRNPSPDSQNFINNQFSPYESASGVNGSYQDAYFNSSFESNESDSASYVSSSTSPIGAHWSQEFDNTSPRKRKSQDQTFEYLETGLTIDGHHAPLKVGKKRGPRPKLLTKEEKKQKRLDANDRERQRMGQLNLAFDNLRNLLPKHGNDRELSKFETIQIAKNYIKALNEMLIHADTTTTHHHHQQSSVP